MRQSLLCAAFFLSGWLLQVPAKLSDTPRGSVPYFRHVDDNHWHIITTVHKADSYWEWDYVVIDGKRVEMPELSAKYVFTRDPFVDHPVEWKCQPGAEVGDGL